MIIKIIFVSLLIVLLIPIAQLLVAMEVEFILYAIDKIFDVIYDWRNRKHGL